MKAIINANLILEDGILFGGALLIDGGLIAGFGPTDALEIPEGAEILDAGGLYIGPGFVDIHCHGGDGALFDIDPASAARHFLRHGTTTVMATLAYQLTYEELIAAIARIQRVIAGEYVGRAIGGIHMEGPFINPKYGASADQNKWQGPIDRDLARGLIRQGGSTVKMWAIAPERDGIEEFMRCAREENPGVVFAAGHSEATPAQVYALKKYGLRVQTHSMDATGQPCDVKGTRSCGPDEACLYDGDMYAEIICDSQGIHVHRDMLRLIAKIKGEDRVILITDGSVSAEQAPENLRRINDLNFDPHGGLSGSKLTMDVACRNMMSHTSCGLCQVFKMASLNPARALGLDGDIGSIERGKRANLVLTDSCMNIHGVILDGEPIQEKIRKRGNLL